MLDTSINTQASAMQVIFEVPLASRAKDERITNAAQFFTALCLTAQNHSQSNAKHRKILISLTTKLQHQNMHLTLVALQEATACPNHPILRNGTGGVPSSGHGTVARSRDESQGSFKP